MRRLRLLLAVLGLLVEFAPDPKPKPKVRMTVFNGVGHVSFVVPAGQFICVPAAPCVILPAKGVQP